MKVYVLIEISEDKCDLSREENIIAVYSNYDSANEARKEANYLYDLHTGNKKIYWACVNVYELKE